VVSGLHFGPVSNIQGGNIVVRRTATLVLVLVLSLCVLSPAFAQKATVLRVLIVKTDNIAAYLQELDRGKEMMKNLGIPEVLRVWQATYAGPEAGTVVVSIEYPSLTAFAEATAKMNTDKDMQAWMKGLDKLRKIVSDSIYKEL
jgi:hypothetical protein